MLPILNPPPSSLPIPSLWVVPVHQPQASSFYKVTTDKPIWGKRICTFLKFYLFLVAHGMWDLDFLIRDPTHIYQPAWSFTHCTAGKSENTYIFNFIQFSSVPQSCLTLCDPVNCSTPGLPVHHQLPEFCIRISK